MPAFLDNLLADPWGLFVAAWFVVVAFAVVQGGIVSAYRAIRRGGYDE